MEDPLRASIPLDLELFETLGFRPGEGFRHLSLHLERMCASAAALAIPFDRSRVQQALAEGIGDQPARVRLALSLDGDITLTSAAVAPSPPSWRLGISTARLQSSNVWLRHKTSQRQMYDEARAALPSGLDELLFMNEAGSCCEGTITNLFISAQGGGLLTPPLSDGLLPGVLRRHLIATGQARVARLRPADLRAASQVFMGNALRGLIPCEVPDFSA